MTKKRQQQIKGMVASVKATYPSDTLKQAKHVETLWNNICTIVSFVIPIILSVVSLLCNEVFTFDAKYETAAQIAFTVIAVITVLVLHRKASNYRMVVSELESERNIHKQEVQRLSTAIHNLKKEQAFLVGFTNQLGQSLADSKCTLKELANLLVVHIYQDCVRRFDNIELTINLYECKSNIIRMIGHQQGNFQNIPLLLTAYPNGADITNPKIRNYYYAQCIKKSDEVFTLSNWKEVVTKFYPDTDRRKKLLKSRETCLEAGVTYNQCVSFRLCVAGTEDTIALLEIISHNDTEIAPEAEIKKVARRLFTAYMPVVMILWNIARETDT